MGLEKNPTPSPEVKGEDYRRGSLNFPKIETNLWGSSPTFDESMRGA